MNASDRKMLNRFNKALTAIKDQLVALRSTNTEGAVGNEVVALYKEIEAAFKGLVPNLDPSQMFFRGGSNSSYCNTAPLIAWLGRAVAAVEAELESAEAEVGSSPITETKDFSFVSNAQLQAILKRDFEEAQKAYVTTCFKSTIILCGGIIEALLIDLLQKNENKAIRATKAQKGAVDSWDLHVLIEVSVELGLLGVGIDRFSHSLRQFRNLVHPGRELRDNLEFGKPEATIALEVLNMLHRGLTKTGV